MLVKKRAKLRRKTQKKRRDTKSFLALNKIRKHIESARAHDERTNHNRFCQSLTESNYHQKLRAYKPVDSLPDIITDASKHSHTSDAAIADVLCK